jgi:hypothetical protein
VFQTRGAQADHRGRSGGVDQRTRRRGLQNLCLDLDRLVGRLDRCERVANRYLCGRQVPRRIALIRTRGVVGVDGIDKAEGDVATHCFVDGPQRGIER